MEDTVKVFDWTVKNAEKYGMDANNIFAVGDSAGGHILALYSALCTNPGYAKKYDFQVNPDATPRAIALNCAVLDMDAIKNSTASNTLMLMKDVLPKGKIDSAPFS